MNGVHDMGGLTDFGPVQQETNEPVFHEEWESRVLAMVRLIIDHRYNWDEFRFAIERIEPTVYLSASYYERWLTALERYLVEKGVVQEGDLSTALRGWTPQPGRAIPAGIRADTAAAPVGSKTQPRFAVGDDVIARNIHPPGHTRLPRYVRGKRGTIVRLLDVEIFPDSNALQQGEYRQPVYAVRFDARELWGEQAATRDGVCVDLWESYLLPA
jgi:nitrile hydratase beta subunit